MSPAGDRGLGLTLSTHNGGTIRWTGFCPPTGCVVTLREGGAGHWVWLAADRRSVALLLCPHHVRAVDHHVFRTRCGHARCYVPEATTAIDDATLDHGASCVRSTDARFIISRNSASLSRRDS